MKGPKPIDQALKEKLEDLEKIKGLMIKGRKLQIAIRLSTEEVEKIMSLEGETFRKKLSGFISSSLEDVTND